MSLLTWTPAPYIWYTLLGRSGTRLFRRFVMKALRRLLKPIPPSPLPLRVQGRTGCFPHPFIVTLGLLLSVGLGACASGGLPIGSWVVSGAHEAALPTPRSGVTQTAGEAVHRLTTLPTATSLPSPTSIPFTPLSSTPLSPTSLSPSPTPLRCLEQRGRIESGQVRTRLLSQPLVFRVYLPPCYLQDVARRYPVVYLIHGQSFNEDQWDRLGADEAADELIAEGKAPPFMIVMPHDEGVRSQPEEDKFGDAVAQVLVPWIDAHYRTLPDRAYRAVGGVSRGGGWALHIGLSEWKIFGAFGAHSLAIFWNDTPHIKEWLDAIPSDKIPRIYLDIGDNDRPEIKESDLWFERLLTQRGIPHEWTLFTGYHEEKYWQKHVKQYLEWYTELW